MAVALLEYRLNLDTTVNYFYRGSGTVVINGTSGDPFFESAVAFANAGFYDGEWVYDYDHNIWKITKVTNTTDDLIFTAFNGEIYREFRSNEIFAFETAPYIWMNAYLKTIDQSNAMIAQIEQKMAEKGVTPESKTVISPLFQNLLNVINAVNYNTQKYSETHSCCLPDSNGVGFSFNGDDYTIKMPLLMMLAKSVRPQRNTEEVKNKRRIALQKMGKIR